MTLFADSAAHVLATRADRATRERAWDAFAAAGLPSTTDEVWRYAPLGDLHLEDYPAPDGPTAALDTDFVRGLVAGAAMVVTVVDGYLVDASAPPAGVSVTSAPLDEPMVDRYGADSFAQLNLALSPATVVLRVDAGVNVEAPIVVLQSVGASAAYPRTIIELGAGASATVVEHLGGGARALVVALGEYHVGQDASLQLVTCQRLDESAWHVARTTAHLARDARLSQAVIGLGAHYDRARNDAVLEGAGAQNELRTTFLGSGHQVHDFRTRQFHLGARSRSILLSKGAVADAARSVYTGLIEIEKGAKRTDARQTNHNLLLSPSAHADSVPNLDIRENDVMCAHASSVGPLDELQRWYLESRGVSRDDAQRLMIQGFFNEMLVALPADVAHLVEADVAGRLAAVSVVTT